MTNNSSLLSAEAGSEYKMDNPKIKVTKIAGSDKKLCECGIVSEGLIWKQYEDKYYCPDCIKKMLKEKIEQVRITKPPEILQKYHKACENLNYANYYR
jgi:hypothetical protein